MEVRYEHFERARNVDIVDVLRMCNMYPDRYGKYICPFHNDREASAYVRVNRLFCFGCHNVEHDGWSTIDVVMKSKSVSKEDAVKMILKLCEHNFNFDKEEVIFMEKQRTKLKKEENPEYEEIRGKFLNKARAVIDSKKDLFTQYLEENRKINKRVLNTLDKNGILYGVDEYNQPAFVFNYRHCVYRRFDRNENHALVITEGAGSYIEIKSNPFPVFYIVEGIYDALTLLDRDNPPNVICLNSVKNSKDLINDIKSNLNHQKRIYILALDNDDIGKKTTQKLINIFEENNIRYNKYLELDKHSECKDVNELRQKDII